MANWLTNVLARALNVKMTDQQAQIWKDVFGPGREAKTGQTITWAVAFESTVYLRCAFVIHDVLGTIPCKLYRKTGGQSEEVTDDPRSDIVRSAPNGFQDSLEWRGMMGIHHAMAGFSANIIVRSGGRIVELIPVEPGIVSMVRGPDLRPRFKIRDAQGRDQEYGPDEIWLWRGPSWDGWRGMDRTRLAREAIALALATEASHSRLHKNGIQTSGVYSLEGVLNAAQYKLLLQNIKARATGDVQHDPLILDRNGKWISQTMNGVDAEHLPTRQFQVEEVCRAAGVLPVMAGYTEGTTSYASVEQMLIAHCVHTARPLWRSWEKSADRWLLSAEERAAGLYFKYSDGELMRGDAASRAAYYSAALGTGGSPPWATQNEVRAWDELPPRSEPWADELPRGTNPAGTPAPKEADNGQA